MIYDIFISYRREGGFDTAKHLNDLLVRDGYTLSFDIDTLREGDFDKALYERIEQCHDFIVIVDEHAFDRMINPAPDYDPEKDWMRKEIAYALKLKKNIISVLLARASYPAKLPEDLDKLDRKNGPKYSREYFDSFYDKLKKFLHSTPRNTQGLVLNPVSNYANLKVKADLDCYFYIDGDEQMTLKAGSIRKLPLAEGEYELEFVSVENKSDYVNITFEMPSKDAVLHINLVEKKAQRIRNEQEAKRKAFLQDKIIFVNGVSFTMKPVEGGTFLMGAQKNNPSGQNYDEEASDNESPVHDVKVNSFYIGEAVVTQELWKAVMGTSVRQLRDETNSGLPMRGEGDAYPMYCINWNDCQEFINKLNLTTGQNFRLPTEAEWEYAARGGNMSKGYKYAGGNTIGNVAWFKENSDCKTHQVKNKQPNELGLYDMSGNVSEWCLDWYSDTYYKVSPMDNPKNLTSSSTHVLRSGSWMGRAKYCLVANRFKYAPLVRDATIGFRLVLPQQAL